jgi:hypothetical protein
MFKKVQKNLFVNTFAYAGRVTDLKGHLPTVLEVRGSNPSTRKKI